jgi:single-stranded-DNA-specific exonuclease
VLRTAISLAGGSAEFHVPDRLKEGYGMREDVIERAARDQINLLISVDNGIRESAVVERATELGVDTIITDHHLPEAAVPRALAVLNPNQPGCEYPDKGLCGAGVAFKLSQALLAGLDWPPAQLQRMLESLLKIVAIGTIADMVPLTGENRLFAKIGLEGLRNPRNPGLRALLGVARLSPSRPVTTEDVAFRLAPRMNAAGRMDKARAVIELFGAKDTEQAAAIAQRLDEFNSDRQRTEEAIVNEILESLTEIPPPGTMPMIVVDGAGWHPGVIGIVASRVVERYHRPCLVLSCDPGTGLATGSGRSIPAFHLLESLESTKDLFTRFGGHRQAAGCTLPIERISELRDRLNVHAGKVLQPDDFVPGLTLDSELLFRDISDEMMGHLDRLAPCGLGNPAPRFSTASVRLAAMPQVIKEKHLKLQVEHGKRFFTAMGWRMAERLEGLQAGAMLDTAFSVEPDTYKGGWQLILKDFRPSQQNDKA